MIDEFIDFGDGPVEDRDFISVVVHIENQVLAHYRQANQSDITSIVYPAASFLLRW